MGSSDLQSKHKIFSCFASLSVIVVVISISLGLELIKNSQIILLIQAENEEGRKDLRVTPLDGKLNGTTLQKFGKFQIRHVFDASFEEFKQLKLYVIDNLPLDQSEAYVPAVVADQLNLKRSLNFKLKVDFVDLHSEIMKRVSRLHYEIKVRVAKVMSQPDGLLSSEEFNDCIIMGYQMFQQVEFLKDYNIREYADQGILLFDDRLDLYMNPDYPEMMSQAVAKASLLNQQLGFQNVDVQMPIMTQIHEKRFGQLFMAIMMRLSCSFIFVISSLLVYNFISITLTDKQPHFATLRLLGMQNTQIIYKIAYDSFKLLFPSILMATLLVIPLQYIMDMILFGSLQVSVIDFLTNTFHGVFYGSLVPIISSIPPAYSMIKLSLRELLDHTKSKTKALKINIEKQDHVSQGKLILAAICIIFGVTLFFILPLSIFTFNFFILLTLLIMILMGYMGGFILLSMNFHFVVEKIFFYFLKHLIDRNMVFIAIKNLHAHRLRNRLVSLIYSISIAFVIFLWTTVNLFLDHNYADKLYYYGADMDIRAENVFVQPQLFDSLLRSNPNVEDFCWVTQGLSQLKFGKQKLQITTLSSVKQELVNIYAMTPNCYQVSKQQFWAGNYQEDPVEALYRGENHNSLLLPDEFRWWLFKKNGEIIQIIQSDERGSKSSLLKINSMITQAPGFKLYRSYTDSREAITSLPTYFNLAGLKSIEEIPMQRIMIKMKDRSGYENVKIQIQGLAKETQQSVSIFSEVEQQIILDQSKQSIQFIFFGLVGLVMLFCCFTLITTMSANINDQIKEIAILKCVGLNKNQITQIYTLESFILILSASLIGLLVGFVTGSTLSHQTGLFEFKAQQPEVPWSMTISITIVAVLIARGSTKYTLNEILKLSPAQLIKRE